jgi:hypothetical protein
MSKQKTFYKFILRANPPEILFISYSHDIIIFVVLVGECRWNISLGLFLFMWLLVL